MNWAQEEKRDGFGCKVWQAMVPVAFFGTKTIARTFRSPCNLTQDYLPPNLTCKHYVQLAARFGQVLSSVMNESARKEQRKCPATR